MTNPFKPIVKLGGRYSSGPLIELRGDCGTTELRIDTGDLSITLALSEADADTIGRALIWYAGIDSPVLRLIEADKETERARAEIARRGK